MQIQKKRKRAHLAGLVASIAAAMFANSVDAGGFEPIQRLGRNCGFGWGDGYHACNDSGFRPGADLPPRSYHKQFFNARALGASCAPGSACAATSFYDQFDAAANIRPRGCDSGGCDSSGWAAADYSTSDTYVVANQGRARSRCDSASCDDPSCEHMGCDSPAVNYIPNYTPGVNAGSQGWGPTQAPPAPTYIAPAAPTQPSYAVPATSAPPTRRAPSQVMPAPAAQSAPSTPPSAAAPSEDADSSVVSPSDRKLVLPEPGFSEDESTALESNGELPAPIDTPAVESIPAPKPDAAPNAGDLPQQIKNPPMPETLGPLDARLSPESNFPEGWTEKPVSANPFIQQDSTNQVKMPATLDLIPEAAGDEDDDLLLFESAQVNPPPARVARAIRPSRISKATYPDWAMPAPANMDLSADRDLPADTDLPADIGINGAPSIQSQQSARPQPLRPRRLPSSLFITQPE